MITQKKTLKTENHLKYERPSIPRWLRGRSWLLFLGGLPHISIIMGIE